jgi:hypothetical protein
MEHSKSNIILCDLEVEKQLLGLILIDNNILVNLLLELSENSFYYDENKASSWFLETPFYTADSHFCSIVQFSAELRNKTQNRFEAL